MDKTLSDFLKSKSVSPEVASQKFISRSSDGRIVIPVMDFDGNIRFNKYRRDPDSSDNRAPKYTYEKGANAMLYNSHRLRMVPADMPAFICEGEFKALCLESFGLLAVSSTGGAGTFKEEWISMLGDRSVFIVFDNDFAGIKNSFSLQQKIPRAKIVFLPITMDGKEYGKDITDLASAVGERFMFVFNGLVNEARNWHFEQPASFQNRDDIATVLSAMHQRVKDVMWAIQDVKAADPAGENRYPWLEIYKSNVIAYIDRLKLVSKFFSSKKTVEQHETELLTAKSVPISNLVPFSPSGFAKSVWNKNDRNPSMKFYPEKNRVFDYSTGRGGDCIDVYMALHSVKFKEAVDKLSSGNY